MVDTIADLWTQDKVVPVEIQGFENDADPLPVIRIAMGVWTDGNDDYSTTNLLTTATQGGALNTSNSVYQEIITNIKTIADECVEKQVYFILDFHIETSGGDNQPSNWETTFTTQDNTWGPIFGGTGTTKGIFKQLFSDLKDAYFNSPYCIIELFNEPQGNHSNEAIYSGTIFNPGMLALYNYITQELAFEGLVLIGSQSYSQDPVGMAQQFQPDVDTGVENIAYTCHVYAASHPPTTGTFTDGYPSLSDCQNLVAGDAGLIAAPVFISEWSITTSTGDGNIDLDSTQEWWEGWILYGMSTCAWQCISSDVVQEASAHLEVSSMTTAMQWPTGTDDDDLSPDLTITGNVIFLLYFGKDVTQVNIPATLVWTKADSSASLTDGTEYSMSSLTDGDINTYVVTNGMYKIGWYGNPGASPALTITASAVE